jgi:hypothetical protein
VHPVNTPVFSSRRAERYAQLLDEAAGGRRHHTRSSADSDLVAMVAVTQRIATLPLAVEVDREFRDGLRASLMARIEREGIGLTAVAPEAETRSRRRLADLVPSGRTRRAFIVSLAAGTLAVSGISAASGSANPGDALYGVKRSRENAQLALAGSDVTRGELNFRLARVRLAEAGSIGNDLTRLGPVLDDMDEATRNGSRLLTTTAVARGDEAPLTAVKRFVAEQRPQVLALSGRLSGPSKARANESLSLLDLVGKRADGLRNTVRCAGQDVEVDELGAKAEYCGRSSSQQPGSPAGVGPESSPQPGGATRAGQPAEPVGTTPSVEANSSKAPKKQDGTGSSGGVVETVEQLFSGIFGN